MKAIILIGHGSRNSISNREFIEFAENVSIHCSDIIFRYAFLELASPSIYEEIEICVEKGANEIILFPLLLLKAGHAKNDFPNELIKAKLNYPEVSFRLEEPLGVQEVLLNILENRLMEKKISNVSHSLILFVGRGSNDPELINFFEKISQLLRGKLQNRIDTCYLIGGHTSFDTAIAKAKNSNFKQIFVLPYLLFNGVLFNRINTSIMSLVDERFVVCSPIGKDKEFVKLVSKLIKKAIS
jgi:sirohydrochlorin ferrochelatase